MNQLTKDSPREILKNYFKGIIALSRSQNKYPVDLDDVWPLFYTRKSDAVYELRHGGRFYEEDDYIVLKSNELILRNFPQNKSNIEEGVKIENRGRKEDKYYLTLSCVEYLVVRRFRPAFNVYRLFLQSRLNLNEGLVYSSSINEDYIFTSDTSADILSEYIVDMHEAEKNGDKQPISLTSVFAIAFPTMQAAINEINGIGPSSSMREGVDYKIVRTGDKQGYYLSIDCFNWLIARKKAVVYHAYSIAVQRNLIDEIPRCLQQYKKIACASMPKRLISALKIEDTPSERVTAILNRIASLRKEVETDEEYALLNTAETAMLEYQSIIGINPTME